MRILVGKGTCGIAAGANRVWERLVEELTKLNIDTQPETVGCIGMCYLEPIVEIIDDSGGQNASRKIYVNVTEEKAEQIAKEVANLPNSSSDYLMESEDLASINSQVRIALRNCGHINPESIDEYILKGGYKAFEKCLSCLSCEQVIEEIKISGLAGRGGAGFPTWFKWQAARNAKGDKKYIICNADEGDPGAFMDRAIIEGDPHTMLEGMLIAAYAIGADEGIVYVRAEYPLAIRRLEHAIKQAREKGYLGNNILEGSFNFNISIKAGAGAFVCGEETALIASLEGERGMPRLKPPFPAEKGLWQKPSNINNVETYANVPWILQNGGGAYAAYGTENSKGTKVFALTGKIAKGGLVEIPMGVTLKTVIYDIGGGIKDGKAFKAVQMGGPSGGCIPISLIDTPIDYRSLSATGAIMGSGGMVVMDEDSCMVDMARYFLDFTCKESCGKCVHCRIGTQRMLEILTRITTGYGKETDMELLENLAHEIKSGALCALGQTAPNPVLTTLKYFKNEFEDHILRKKCTARHCTSLINYNIDAKKCTGCTLCARDCPVNAITGELKESHEINAELCVKCGKCVKVCRSMAVYME